MMLICFLDRAINLNHLFKVSVGFLHCKVVIFPYIIGKYWVYTDILIFLKYCPVILASIGHLVCNNCYCDICLIVIFYFPISSTFINWDSSVKMSCLYPHLFIDLTIRLYQFALIGNDFILWVIIQYYDYFSIKLLSIWPRGAPLGRLLVLLACPTLSWTHPYFLALQYMKGSSCVFFFWTSPWINLCSKDPWFLLLESGT